MRFLIDALSATNASGRHVLLGHLGELARRTAGRHEFVVLWHAGNAELVRDLGPGVTWRRCPALCRHWAFRAVWEHAALGGICRREGIGGVFAPSGMALPVSGLPQVVLAMNPWALVGGAPRTGAERVKAFLQRRGYREAVRRAAVLVFVSEFMAGLYTANAGGRPRRSAIAPIGIDDATFAAARSGGARVPGQIVSVSAMAPHKDVATLLRAVAGLRDRFGYAAQLKLVGAWPDARYRAAMVDMTGRLGLRDAVEFTGHVSREDLHRFYAGSAVFALFSRCESFGIPAIEAQAFGTPVVGAACCAVREVCGDGGEFVAPGDDRAGAAALHRLLTDPARWRVLSARAGANADRFRWPACTAPLIEAFEAVAGG